MYRRLWFFFLIFPLGCFYICASHFGRNTTKPKQDSQFEFKGPQTAQVRAASPLYSSSFPSNFWSLRNPYLKINNLFFGGGWGDLSRCVLKLDCLENDILFLLPLKKYSRYSFVRQKKERLSQDSVIRETGQLVSCFLWFSKPVSAKKVSFSIRHFSSWWISVKTIECKSCPRVGNAQITVSDANLRNTGDPKVNALLAFFSKQNGNWALLYKG